MSKSAREKVSGFARASKKRLSGRRLVGPKSEKAKPMVIEMVDKSGSRRRPNREEEAADDDAAVAFLDASSFHEDVDASTLEPPAPKGEDNCCILCVGSTGTGKSSTIAKLTEQKVRSSNSTRRVTQRCTMYRPLYHSKSCIFETRNVFFVDTVGWDDADRDDDDTFKEVLKFLDAHNIANIKAVVWTVNKNVRQDATLNRQAALIDKFSEKEIWNRVIIVGKQAGNPDQDVRGALAAALDYNPRARVQTTGFLYLNDSSFTMEQSMSLENDTKMRETWNVKTDDEIRQAFKELLANVDDPVKIVFNDKRCLDCGAVGDPRLLPKFCHMKAIRVHRVKEVERVHPLDVASFHPEEIPIKTHPGYLHQPQWYRNPTRKQAYSCCGGKLTAPGCALKWKCCAQQHKISKEPPAGAAAAVRNPQLGCRKKYLCCNAPVETAPSGCEDLYSCCGRNRNQDGCLEICVKCEKLWGTDAEKCYVRQHNVVVDIVENKKEEKVISDGFDTIRKAENGLEPKRSFLERLELPSAIPYPII